MIDSGTAMAALRPPHFTDDELAMLVEAVWEYRNSNRWYFDTHNWETFRSVHLKLQAEENIRAESQKIFDAIAKLIDEAFPPDEPPVLGEPRYWMHL